MTWDLQWGKPETLKFLEAQEKATGEQPEALRNRPRLKAWQAEYYLAFHVLKGCRQIGMGGVGSIPISEMQAYFEMIEVTDPEERLTYVMMIQALDSVYLMHVNKSPEKDKGDSR